MKRTSKQRVILVLCVILLFVPTYIALAHYYSGALNLSRGKYSVTIVDESYSQIHVGEGKADAVAALILKINSKLTPVTGIPAALPTKKYTVTVSDDNGAKSTFSYYFVAKKNADSFVCDTEGNFYRVSYNDTKGFLSNRIAYHFYDHSMLPTLSIDGGSDIIPSRSDWKYRAVNGSMLRPPESKRADGIESYAMRSTTPLSFSVEPNQCSVRVYDGDRLLGKYSSLSDIPYDLTDSSSLTFRIDAKWDHADYEGSAYYEFSTHTGLDPVYTVLDTSIQSGEFFVVEAKNVDAPEKIEFSSIPEIGVTPVFYKENGRAYALIPIKKELATPCELSFTFKYGGSVEQINVYVESRSVNDKTWQVNSTHSKQALDEYNTLLSIVGANSSDTRYFNGRLLDYCPDDAAMVDIAEGVFFGFGHRIIPTDGSDPYRLDGVVYIFNAGAEVPAICGGRVSQIGSSEMLGNYVIVDHGFGLKTWYCHLSSVSVSVDTMISTGQSVGVSGETAYNGINGVYLITTVYGVPVSPYPLQEKGFYLPE